MIIGDRVKYVGTVLSVRDTMVVIREGTIDGCNWSVKEEITGKTWVCWKSSLKLVGPRKTEGGNIICEGL